MVSSAKDQADVIEQFLFEIIETEEYKAVEYLAFSIYKPMLDYFTSLRTKENTFPTPPFLIPAGRSAAGRAFVRIWAYSGAPL